ACALVLFTNLVIKTPRESPAHAKHVPGGAHGAISQAVFRLTKTAGPMVHWDFNQPIPCVFDQRRNEAMHSLERKQRADALEPHCFERTTRVAHPVFRVPTTNRIRNPASEPFHTRVPALRTIAANEVGAA